MIFKELCESLETKIQSAYEQGVTLDEAEKLAAQFLYAQLQVSAELKSADLDARMRKSGLKAIRSSVYKETAFSGDKKPTEAAIGATIDAHKVVQSEQDALDMAEVSRDNLERYYDIFMNAHVYFRGIAKGRFD